MLNLVDSPVRNASVVQARRARLKEACAINKSLSCLGDVFQALLTDSRTCRTVTASSRLLQPCPERRRALMFVNINPESPSAEESLCSLSSPARSTPWAGGGGRGGGGAKRAITSGMSSNRSDGAPVATPRGYNNNNGGGCGGGAADRAAVRREAAAAAASAKAALGGAGAGAGGRQAFSLREQRITSKCENNSSSYRGNGECECVCVCVGRGRRHT